MKKKILISYLKVTTLELGSGFICNVSTMKEFNRTSPEEWTDSKKLTTTSMFPIVTYNSGRSANSSAI